MRCPYVLPLAAALVLMVFNLGCAAGAQPQFFPTRDLSIIYDVSWPNRPRIRERVRWLARTPLERIDGPNHSTLVLLNAASRTYSAVNGAPRWAIEPKPSAVLNRGAESVIAGLRCIDWSWTEDTETHTACLSPDGVLLRLMVDDETRLEARSVSYGAQADDLFQVPLDYVPALEWPQAPRLVR